MQARTIYNIIELGIYGPGILGSLVVARRHEDATKSAWTSLTLFGITRVAAASTSLADSLEPSRSLQVAATVMDPVSLAALLCTPLFLLTRVNATMWQQRAPQRYFWLAIFPLIIALVVGLIGSLNINSTDQTNVAKGWTRLQLSSAFFCFETIILVAVTAFNMLRYSHVPKSEVRLLYSVAIGTPVSLCPTIFALSAACMEQSRYFWRPNSGVGLILSAALMTGPEVVALVAYIWAALTVRLVAAPPPTDAERLPPAYVESPREETEVSEGRQFNTALRALGRKEAK